ncbi:MAG: hypothetical protein ABW092_15755 [Candidatus Thiodiazotropha sp.]
MVEKELLDIIIMPSVLTMLTLAWPTIQRRNRRNAFRKLILRELEEIAPHPVEAGDEGWWVHQKKNFVHKKIFQEASENRDFILSLEPDMIYLVTQLWDAKANKDERQWQYYLKELSNPKYDMTGEIANALKKWEVLCEKYRALQPNN